MSKSGLEGVVVAETKLSEVDGERGRLIIAGHDVEALAGLVSFDRMAAQLLTAVLLDAVGLPRTMFTPTFAVGRVAGWCAHVAEQRATGRLIRPASTYIGPMPEVRA